MAQGAWRLSPERATSSIALSVHNQSSSFSKNETRSFCHLFASFSFLHFSWLVRIFFNARKAQKENCHSWLSLVQTSQHNISFLLFATLLYFYFNNPYNFLAHKSLCAYLCKLKLKWPEKDIRRERKASFLANSTEAKVGRKNLKRKSLLCSPAVVVKVMSPCNGFTKSDIKCTCVTKANFLFREKTTSRV